MPSGIYQHKSSWNKGRKMTDYPQCGFQKGHCNWRMDYQFGTNNSSWKGNKVLYRALHTFISSRKGKASEFSCVDCGRQAREWSNIDHSYRRILDDYDPRCVKCHKIYDKQLK